MNDLPQLAPEFVASVASLRPRTPREVLLCEMYTAVLGVDRISIDDGFFDLGGDPLLAVRLISRIRTSFGVELPIRVLVEAPSVAQLAVRLEQVGTARRVPGRCRDQPPSSTGCWSETVRLGGSIRGCFCGRQRGWRRRI